MAQAFGALLATALIVIPQRIKHKNKKELAALRHYQETVSVHVDNAAEEVDPALNVKQLRVLSNLNEADHGSTYEWEAGVAGFIAVLKFLSFWDEMKQPGKELEVCCIALVTALLALAAAALTRKALRDEQKRFRNEMQKFLRRIPGNTRVAYDVGMGEGHELEVERKAAEKGRK